MQRHFPHIIKQLISPSTVTPSQQSANFFTRYFSNRANLKYCKKLWPGSSKQSLINESVNLRRQLQQAVQQQDKVLLLRVCSIPLYNDLKQKMKLKTPLQLGSWGYHFQLMNVYRIKSNQNNSNIKQHQQHKTSPTQQQEDLQNHLNMITTKPTQWIRVQLKYKQQTTNNHLVDKQLVIQRRVDEDNISATGNKWYIYQISI